MKANEKDLISSIIRTNLGIYLIFFAVWIAFNYFWYLGPPQYLVGLAIMIIVAFFVAFSGLRELNRHKDQIKAISNLKLHLGLSLNTIAFALMGMGAYLLSFYKTQTITSPTGSSHVSFLHLYSAQALTLFLIGTGIELIAGLSYYYLIPKQAVKEEKV
jgi:hypothetical protein